MSTRLKTQLYGSVKLPEFLENKLFNNEKKDIGICFSGGGPRSFSATIGYIRSLYKMDVLRYIKYVSCVSGSTWAWIPFIYVEGNIERFLGLDFFNNKRKVLTLDDIKYTDTGYLGNSIISLASNCMLMKYLYDGTKYLNNASRLYPYMLGKIFLEPFGLMDNKFLAPNRKIADIFDKKIQHTSLDYRIPSDNDAPFLICSTNVAKNSQKKTLINTDFTLIEMTPLYSGTLSELEKNNVKYGGNLINTYSYSPISYINGNTEVENEHFNLYDMMGSSSTAYGIVMDYLGMSFANPSYSLVNNNLNRVESFDCIDGGVLDNTGILPMLRRGVKNIVLFVNTSSKIDTSFVENDDIIMTKSIDVMLRQLFLGNSDVDEDVYLYHFRYKSNLKVFRDGEDRWKELLCQMRYNIDRNDVAFVELRNLEVLENVDYQIGRYVVEKLQIIYLYQQKNWRENRLENNITLPENFPYYKTIFEDDGWIDKELLSLTAEEVNLLADMACYNLEGSGIINEKFMDLF